MVAEYRSGLEAEVALLRQIDSLSMRQQEATLTGDYAALRAIHERREAVMANLVSVEHELKPLRAELAAQREMLQHSAQFQEVAARHAEAAEMVRRIIASDGESLRALQDAELARRAAAAATERGETTLHAYRRVIAPTISNATLVNRKG